MRACQTGQGLSLDICHPGSAAVHPRQLSAFCHANLLRLNLQCLIMIFLR